MKRNELLEILNEHKETLIDGIVLALRECKYANGFPYFGSDEEAYAIIKHFYYEMDSLNTTSWGKLLKVKFDYHDNRPNQKHLSELSEHIAGIVMTGLNLLAVIEKAKETIEYDDIWKEQRYGNSKETDDSDEEV